MKIIRISNYIHFCFLAENFMKIEFEIYREIFKWKKTFDPELYIIYTLKTSSTIFQFIMTASLIGGIFFRHFFSVDHGNQFDWWDFFPDIFLFPSQS